jgi:acyl carrier protein
MSTITRPTGEQVREQVRQALRGQLGDLIDPVDDTDDLPTALGDRYDSLGAMECVSTIETAFGFEVDFVADDVRYAFGTIGRIVAFVQDKLDDLAVLREPS